MQIHKHKIILLNEQPATIFSNSIVFRLRFKYMAHKFYQYSYNGICKELTDLFAVIVAALNERHYRFVQSNLACLDNVDIRIICHIFFVSVMVILPHVNTEQRLIVYSVVSVSVQSIFVSKTCQKLIYGSLQNLSSKITSLPKVIWEERRVAALSHAYAVKSPLVTMARPKFASKSTPSRGPIPKPHYLAHLWTRPTYEAKRHPDPICRFATMHWTN